MKPIPETQDAVVVRTDFSNEARWDALREEIVEPTPIDGFRAYVDFVSDPAHQGLTVEEVIALIPETSPRTFLFIADERTMTDPESPILVVDLVEEPGRTFRVVPAEMWAVENNLSVANMDFDEFFEEIDSDGVYRGLPKF